MNVDWQNLAAVCIVLAAAACLLRHLLRVGTRKKPPGCGACAECDVPARKDQLLSIDPPEKEE